MKVHNGLTGLYAQLLPLFSPRCRPVVEVVRVCGGKPRQCWKVLRLPSSLTLGAGTRFMYDRVCHRRKHSTHSLTQAFQSMPECRECRFSLSGRCAHQREVCVTSGSVMQYVGCTTDLRHSCVPSPHAAHSHPHPSIPSTPECRERRAPVSGRCVIGGRCALTSDSVLCNIA